MKFNIPMPGDHLCVRRNPVDHHGIYVAHNQIIEFTKRYGPPVIKVSPFDEFASGQLVYRVEHEHCLANEEVIRRATRRLGDSDYSLFHNNCEHFAMWCKTGTAISRQVERAKEVAVKLLELTAQALQQYQRMQETRKLGIGASIPNLASGSTASRRLAALPLPKPPKSPTAQ